MNQHNLFNRTRQQLALSYALGMGLILSLLGLGSYEAIAHAHRMAIERELTSVTGTLHDSLELQLKEPGKIPPVVSEILPNLRLVTGNKINYQALVNNRHILSAVNHGNYYIRLFDMSGQLMAIAGDYPEHLSSQFIPQSSQTLTDNQNHTYQQISVSLHTQNLEDWGYLQIGRNLQDFQTYLQLVEQILLLGIPLALILITTASWWLSGLAMRPIYQSYQQMQQFTADVAHELRTPLAAIQATVESALIVDHLPVTTTEYEDILLAIKRQNRRLIQLVNDLLLLAKMDRQTLLMRQEPCNLNDLVNDLVEELAVMAIASQIKLIATINVDQELTISGDRSQLERLVTNLIVNAIQYTPSGGTVTVILGQENHLAMIQVKDTGIGISAAEQKQIFHRFYRVNSDRSRASGGAGLGLAIAQSIAHRHHGSLTVESVINQGSTFTFRLPIKNLKQ